MTKTLHEIDMTSSKSLHARDRAHSRRRRHLHFIVVNTVMIISGGGIGLSYVYNTAP